MTGEPNVPPIDKGRRQHRSNGPDSRFKWIVVASLLALIFILSTIQDLAG